jgi:hypothetical protein
MIESTNYRNRCGVYLQAVLKEACRTIGFEDRDPSSVTFGCLDRTYWAWKFTDFPGARFQEGLCVLSLLFSNQFDGNPFFNQEKLLEWIAGGFDFWNKIQYADGSFDEAYPFERSLAATAFTAFYLSEAWNFLDGNLPAQCAERFKSALFRSGTWLCKNDEKHGFLSNHLAAAAAALYHIYRITGENRFEERSNYFLEKILKNQSAEGWYNEYGGADPGYQTHGSFYLARLYELSKQKRIVESLERSFEFIVHFIHPDQSIGGEYASRNTQTYYPAAFEMMAPLSERAGGIAFSMLGSVESLKAAGLGSIDAYNYFPLLNNYVFAYLGALGTKDRPAAPEIHRDNSSSVYFKAAGITKVVKENFELYVGLQKGGVLKVFDRKNGKLVLNDCGYIGRLKSGKLISSQVQDESREIQTKENEILIKGSFGEFKRPVMSPFSFIGFRIFSLTFGRLKTLSYWLKSLLVKVLIYRKKEVDLHFERKISWQENYLKISDRIQGNVADQLESMQWRDLFTTIHMGSSRYFIPNELNDPAISEGSGNEDIDLSKLEEGVVIERTVTFK